MDPHLLRVLAELTEVCPDWLEQYKGNILEAAVDQCILPPEVLDDPDYEELDFNG